MQDYETARELGALRQAVTNLTEQWQRQDNAATEGRRQLHKGMSELSREQAEMKQQLATLTKEVAEEVKPVIKRVQEDRWRTEGMKSLGKLLWLSAGAFITGVSWVIYTFFGIGKPPH